MYSNSTQNLGNSTHEINYDIFKKKIEDLINEKGFLPYPNGDHLSYRYNMTQDGGININSDDIEDEIQDILINNFEKNGSYENNKTQEHILINNENIIVDNTNIKNPDNLSLLSLTNNEEKMLILTELKDSEIEPIQWILKLFNYTYKFIELDSNLKNKIKENVKNLKYINYLCENGTLNSKLDLDNSEDINKKFLDVCKFLQEYGNILNIEKDENIDEKTNNKNSDWSIDNVKPYNCAEDFTFEPYYTNILNLIRKNSFIVFFNIVTKKYVLIEYTDDNAEWYTNFVLNKNKYKHTILKKLNLDIIKFIHHDNTDKQYIIQSIRNGIYDNIKDIETHIKEYIDNLDDFTSIEFLKKTLKTEYDISCNVEYIVQFTNIYNNIINIIKKKFDTNCTPEQEKKIKYILPHVLEMIGLKKKRTSKGMMWYGLNSKNISH